MCRKPSIDKDNKTSDFLQQTDTNHKQPVRKSSILQNISISQSPHLSPIKLRQSSVHQSNSESRKNTLDFQRSSTYEENNIEEIDQQLYKYFEKEFIDKYKYEDFQLHQIQSNIVTDSQMIQQMHPNVVDKYYNNLVPGLEYEKLMYKDKYFTEFKMTGGIRLFKYFYNQELSEGDGFGDSEFFNNSKKSDGLVCITDCVLASINKVQFSLMNKRIEWFKIRELVQLLQKSIYQIVNDLGILNKIAQLYEKIKVNKGIEIYKENDSDIQYCYFIRKGELSVIKNSKQTCLIGQYKHFGEEEIILEYDKRNFTVQVNSLTASIYRITKENFIKVIEEIYPDLLEVFKSRCQANIEYRKQQISIAKNTILILKQKKYGDKYIDKQIDQISQDLKHSKQTQQILQKSLTKYYFDQNILNCHSSRNVDDNQTSHNLKQKLHKQTIQFNESMIPKIHNKQQLDPQIKKFIRDNHQKEKMKVVRSSSIENDSILHHFQDKSSIRVRNAFIKKQKQGKDCFKSKSLEKYSERLDQNIKQLTQRQFYKDSNGNQYKQELGSRYSEQFDQQLKKQNTLMQFQILAQNNIQQKKEKLNDIQMNPILPKIKIQTKVKSSIKNNQLKVKNNPIRKQNYDLYQQQDSKVFYF